MRLRTFEKLWHQFNVECFGSTMFAPKFRRTRSNDYWACYMDTEGQGTIIINRKSHPHMIAILFHEMVHQYVEEVLGIVEDDHHGEVFWITYYEFAPYNLSIAETF